MNRRIERRSLHDRIHGAPVLAAPDPEPVARPAADAAVPIRPCWVSDDQGRLPALLLEWRRTVSGWQGRVVRPVLEEGCWVVVEEWLPAALLTPSTG